MNYEYKTVKFQHEGSGGWTDSANDLQKVLDQYASQGWEYMNSITPSQYYFVLLVFRRLRK